MKVNLKKGRYPQVGAFEELLKGHGTWECSIQ
jgi:hypothetical protein